MHAYLCLLVSLQNAKLRNAVTCLSVFNIAAEWLYIYIVDIIPATRFLDISKTH
jgi:hypothetical protein